LMGGRVAHTFAISFMTADHVSIIPPRYIKVERLVCSSGWPILSVLKDRGFGARESRGK